MQIILIILFVIFGYITAQFYGLYQHGGSIPDWASNILGGAIGSIVAILGSVLIQVVSDTRKEKQNTQVHLTLLKKEFYDNFMVCLFRIDKASDEIAFFYDVYNNLIINGTYNKNDKQFQERLSDLYFLLKRGNYGKKTFSEFYREVFSIQQKKPRNFQDVLEIIESVGIDQIYEFSILQQIIIIDYYHKLNINLPSKDFQKVLNYDESLNRDLYVDIKYYITELVCKKFFNGDKVIYFSDTLKL